MVLKHSGRAEPGPSICTHSIICVNEFYLYRFGIVLLVCACRQMWWVWPRCKTSDYLTVYVWVSLHQSTFWNFNINIIIKMCFSAQHVETGTAGVSGLVPTGCFSFFYWNCREFRLICIRTEGNFMTFPQTCPLFIGTAVCVCASQSLH